ncbi:hypothetical protein ACFSQ6_15060 [Sphingobacterium populi]|uniref:Uncharacterized protein n=2 Tax=Sphingobacterium populi TaxID=1812824 RepID=A0ABW5UHT5_9SPHI|nr:hypothetical protein [Sphingobacterium sp. CFCC 11742]
MHTLSFKQTFKKLFSPPIFATLLFLTFMSCQKTSNEKELIQDETEVTFELNGVDDAQERAAMLSHNPERRVNSTSTPTTSHHTVEDTKVEDFDMSTTLMVSSELDRIESSWDSESPKTTFSSSAKRAAIVPMPAGRQFRILIYEQSGTEWRFVTHTDFVSAADNQGKTVKLIMDKTYRWIAYSYDSTDPITDAVPQIGSTVAPTISTRPNQPTLYSSGGQFTNTANTATQYILFRHRTSKVEVVVDTRGMFDIMGRYVTDISSLNAQLTSTIGGVGKLTTATLDLFTGQLSNQTPHNAAGVALNFANLDDINGSDLPHNYSSAKISTNSLYTALSAQQANFSVTINSANITESGGFADDAAIVQTGTRARALVAPTAPRTATFTSGTADNSVGRVFRVNFRFAHRGVLMGNNYWASGALYFRDNEYRIDRVRFISTAFRQASNAPREFYWRYGKRYPHQTGTTAPFVTIPPLNNPIGDPCSFMQPRGIWRTSTRADQNDLAGRPRTRAGAGAQNLVVYFPSTDAAPPNEYAFLYVNGMGYYSGGNPSFTPPQTNNQHGVHMNSLSMTNPPPLQNPNNQTYNGLIVAFPANATSRMVNPSTPFGMTASHTVRCVRNAM